MRWQSESDERRHRFGYEGREGSSVRGVQVEPKRRRHFVLPPHSTLASDNGLTEYLRPRFSVSLLDRLMEQTPALKLKRRAMVMASLRDEKGKAKRGRKREREHRLSIFAGLPNV